MAIVVEKGKEGKLEWSQRRFVAHITLNIEIVNNIVVSIALFNVWKRKQHENVMIVICTYVTIEKMMTAFLTIIRSMLLVLLTFRNSNNSTH